MVSNFKGSRASASLAVIAVGILTVGVSCRRETAPEAAPAAAQVFRISPSNLFTGDLKRLEPHLGLSTGCVRLEFDGPAPFVGFEVEVWEAGRLVRPLGSSKSRTNGPGEASFSVQELTDTKGQKKYRLVTAVSGKSGSASSTREVDQPPRGDEVTASGPVGLSEPRELPEGEAVTVWAYQIHSDGGRFDGRPLEEAIRAARWALVVKIRWERPEGK